MTIKCKVETTVKSKVMVNVRFRLTDGRSNELWIRSEIKVDVRFWDNDNECYRNVKACPYTIAEQKQVKDAVALRKMLIEEVYVKLYDGKKLTSKSFNEYVNKFIEHGSIDALKVDVLTEHMARFIMDRRYGVHKAKTINTLIKAIKRFEKYKSHIKGVDYMTELKDVDKFWLKDFMAFFENEFQIIETYPELYSNQKELRSFSIRTSNYIIEVMGNIRRFWNWALDEELVQHNPFDFRIASPVYEDPIVMTKGEVALLYNTQVDDERLDKVKSLFLFQLSIGCRINEIDAMTKSRNLIELEEDGIKIKAVEYNQPKTAKISRRKPATPLNVMALEMMNKYYFTTNRIMPKVSLSTFNKDLKRLFKMVGLDRKFLVMNKETGQYEREPLYRLVSSHMARRTFLSLAVNSGADKSVYTSITGHKVNTPHLDRYIFVQPTTKKALVDNIFGIINEPFIQSQSIG